MKNIEIWIYKDVIVPAGFADHRFSDLQELPDTSCWQSIYSKDGIIVLEGEGVSFETKIGYILSNDSVTTKDLAYEFYCRLAFSSSLEKSLKDNKEIWEELAKERKTMNIPKSYIITEISDEKGLITSYRREVEGRRESDLEPYKLLKNSQVRFENIPSYTEMCRRLTEKYLSSEPVIVFQTSRSSWVEGSYARILRLEMEVTETPFITMILGSATKREL